MKVPLRGQWVALAFFSFVFFMPVRAAETENFKWVRAVRLSFIQGKVNLQRSDPNRSLQALVHTPIQEGFTVTTEAGGFAGVEFENGSTVRVGENSELFFGQLARVRDTGTEVTRLLLRRGYATFNIRFEEKDTFEVESPQVQINLDQSAEFRVDLDSPFVHVKVFRGQAMISAPSGTLRVESDQFISLNLEGDPLVQLRSGIVYDDWDKWNRRRNEIGLQMQRYPHAASGPYYGGEYNDLDKLYDVVYDPHYYGAARAFYRRHHYHHDHHGYYYPYRFGFYRGFHYGPPYLWTGLRWYGWNFSFGYPYDPGHNLYYSLYRYPYRTLNPHPHRGGRRRHFRNRTSLGHHEVGRYYSPAGNPYQLSGTWQRDLQRKYPGAFGRTSTLAGVISPVPSTDFRTTTKFVGDGFGRSFLGNNSWGRRRFSSQGLGGAPGGRFHNRAGDFFSMGSTVALSSDLPSRTMGSVRMYPARARDSQASRPLRAGRESSFFRNRSRRDAGGPTVETVVGGLNSLRGRRGGGMRTPAPSRFSRRTGSAGPSTDSSSPVRSTGLSRSRRIRGRQNVPPLSGRTSSVNRASTRRGSNVRTRTFHRTTDSVVNRGVETRQVNRTQNSSRTSQRSRYSGYRSRGLNRARSHQSAGRSTPQRSARSHSSPGRSSHSAARTHSRGGGSRSRSYSSRGRSSSGRHSGRAASSRGNHGTRRSSGRGSRGRSGRR